MVNGLTISPDGDNNFTLHTCSKVRAKARTEVRRNVHLCFIKGRSGVTATELFALPSSQVSERVISIPWVAAEKVCVALK